MIPLLVLVLCALPATAADDWALVWADEFTDEGLPDSSRWRYDVGGHGWGNRELQYYTARRLANARVEDGLLVIEARREAFNDRDYTSARLLSRADWTYGRFEVRARLPSGTGTWPAIWMLASRDTYGDHYWPDNGEIDIMEYVGYEPDVVHSSVHTRAYHHSIGTHKTNSRRVADAEKAFHVYAVDWTAAEIRFFVDGQRYFTFVKEEGADYRQWPFDQPFHLLLNIAVGGTWGGQQGIADDIWPQRMEIDYVRVYQPSTAIDGKTWGEVKDR